MAAAVAAASITAGATSRLLGGSRGLILNLPLGVCTGEPLSSNSSQSVLVSCDPLRSALAAGFSTFSTRSCGRGECQGFRV